MSHLPKIVLLTLEYPPQVGGVGRYYAGLVQHWPEPITVQRLGLSWPFWPRWLPFFWQVGRLLRKEKAGMLWVGQVLPLGYVVWWFKKRRRIPYLVFTHGMDILVPQKSRWKKRWLRKILADADLVVSNSEFTRGEAVKLGVSIEKTAVVYPCPAECHSDRVPTLVGTSGGISQKIILSVGRLVKRKGFDKVIEVMPRLLKRIPEVKYVIIGAGPEVTGYRLQVTGLELEDKVMIIEKTSDTELSQWYQACDVFVLPCRQIDGDVEGFGMVFLEAASFGKPVIVGRSGGAPETTHHGYGGFVVDPESPEELYQALVRLLTDEAFSQRMGEYGRNWVAKKFRWEVEVEKLRERIKDIVRQLAD